MHFIEENKKNLLKVEGFYAKRFLIYFSDFTAES
jgi:hypothetical protein